MALIVSLARPTWAGSKSIASKKAATENREVKDFLLIIAIKSG